MYTIYALNCTVQSGLPNVESIQHVLSRSMFILDELLVHPSFLKIFVNIYTLFV